jgi:Flp pilus assembly protein TadG
MDRKSFAHSGRRGGITVLAAAFLVIVSIFLAFSIDYGYLVVTESELQNAADAGAMSGAKALKHGRAAAIQAAKNWGNKNKAAGRHVAITDADVIVGKWDSQAAAFFPLASDSTETANAVQVTCQRAEDRGTALNLFFTPIWGVESANVQALATAVSPSTVGTKLLIDEEVIDTDVPSIETLASQMGRSPADLLNPRGLNAGKQRGGIDWVWEDNFLDLPKETVLHLPTGQGTSYDNNDAGLFEITHPAFPFRTNPSFMEFLTNQLPFSSLGQLDPLVGVTPMTSASMLASLVDPDFIHVSPVFKSDISTLNMANGVPQVNALGERRGLLAFKIMCLGQDVDGSGSVLPMLVIRTVDPHTISPSKLGPSGVSSGTKLVQ